MQKVLDWGVPNSTEVKNEKIGSILLHIKSLTSGLTVANLISLAKIEIGISVKRGNFGEKSVFDGYLSDLLQFMYAGTTRLETVLTKTSIGYLINLEFAYPFNIGINDVLKVKTNFGAAPDSFTDATNSDSSIVMYTNPSALANPNNFAAIHNAFQIPTGDVDFEKFLGVNVGKVIFHGDPELSFDDQKIADVPLPLSCELIAMNYGEDKTQVELLSTAKLSLSYNPDTEVKNLVVYNSNSLLNNLKTKIKLSKPATIHTKVLVTKFDII